MARIAPVPRDRQPPLVRSLNRGASRLLGQEAAPRNVVAHNPGFVVPYLATTRCVRGRTHLDPEVRALATQLVAAINGCSWCLDFGQYSAEREGVDAGKLLAVTDYATDPRFLPDERAALAYAAAATEVGARVPATSSPSCAATSPTATSSS